MNRKTLKLQDLKKECKTRGFKGWSSFKKDELITFLECKDKGIPLTKELLDKKESKKKKKVSEIAEYNLKIFSSEELQLLGEKMISSLLTKKVSSLFDFNNIGEWIGKNIDIAENNDFKVMKIKIEIDRVYRNPIFSEIIFDPLFLTKGNEELLKNSSLHEDYIEYYTSVLIRSKDIFNLLNEENQEVVLENFLNTPFNKIDYPFRICDPLPKDIQKFTLIYFYYESRLRKKIPQKGIYYGDYDNVLKFAKSLISDLKILKISKKHRPAEYGYTITFFAKIYEGDASNSEIIKDYFSSNNLLLRRELSKCNSVFSKIGGKLMWDFKSESYESSLSYIIEKLKKKEEYLIPYFYSVMEKKELKIHPLDNVELYDFQSLYNFLNEARRCYFCDDGNGVVRSTVSFYRDIPYTQHTFDWYQRREMLIIEDAINILISSSTSKDLTEEEEFPLNLLMLKEVIFLNTLDIFKRRLFST